MSKALSLLVGLKKVNSLYYAGWDGTDGCWGCELDVDNMERILQPLGYNNMILKTQQATANNILNALTYATTLLESGDIFVFYYAGHGGQQPDVNGDELDGQDETLVAYDREIIDDDLNKIWEKMKAGVRIVMVSDSCNSGTNYRLRATFSTPTPFVPLPETRSPDLMRAQMIHFGGTRDGFPSVGYNGGGAFTYALVEAWQNGNFDGNYPQFYQRITELIDADQHPQYNEYGPVTDDFRNQVPFSTTGRSSEVIHTITGGIRARVISSSLNIRRGPGTNYEKVTALNQGDVVSINSFDGSDVWVEIGEGKWAAFAYRGRRYMEIISD